MREETDIKCYTEGQIAFCILNRPKQLNALTLTMNQVFKEALLEWKDDASIKIVVIMSSNERAFCAGGDIKQVYQIGQKDLSAALDFFSLEYGINWLLANYPKPIIVFCQGVTMGGGCGIGFHVSHAIAGDCIKLAMPETKIGLFPDIGASYIFPRLKNYIGYYLGLTGDIIGQADVNYTGLMRYGMTNANWQGFLGLLKEVEWGDDAIKQLDQLLESYHVQAKASAPLVAIEKWINNLYSVSTLHELLDGPHNYQSNEEAQWQQKTIADMKQRCPQSLLLTWVAFNRGKKMSLQQVLEQDLILAKTCLTGRNFYQGVQACLIDRGKPTWENESIQAYSQDDIKAWFS